MTRVSVEKRTMRPVREVGGKKIEIEILMILLEIAK